MRKVILFAARTQMDINLMFYICLGCTFTKPADNSWDFVASAAGIMKPVLKGTESILKRKIIIV